MNIKAIAIHLPQFHPITENDQWWGKGFTEWTNVTKAKPFFKGHYQPHLPADLGFYDLRLEEARVAQAELAKQFGIHAFCYYHYWFGGKRLLNRPLDDMLKTKTPDFPFMLCWANENWTRRWDGYDQEILIRQEYNTNDDLNHIRFLLENFFSDDRYIKVEGKPFMLIYRPALFPDIRKTLEVWRSEACRLGFKDLFIGYMQSFSFREPPGNYGFDCAVEFQPDFDRLPVTLGSRILKKLLSILLPSSKVYKNRIYSYNELVDIIIRSVNISPNTYRTVCPMWDNSARRQTGATMFNDSTPEIFERWLSYAAEATVNAKNPGNFLFINAWNEWAEGNHLEPCLKWGRRYLESTRQVLTIYA